MANKSGDLGTKAATAVVNAITRWWPNAERRVQKGNKDEGDITGTPGICWEVKGGNAAKTASDGQIEKWLDETEVERVNAGADVGVLVVQRKGFGYPNAHRWWAIIRDVELLNYDEAWSHATVRMPLEDMCKVLQDWGY